MRVTARNLLIAAVAVVVAHLLDGWAWSHLGVEGVYDHDAGRLFRVIGFVPLWLWMGAALWLVTRDRRRAALLALVPALGGLVSELLKLLLRRERPGLHDGAYVFRPFRDQTWSTSGLGMPSGHTMVAFTGAFMLCKLFPRAWPVWITLAAGTALTRVQAQAHFLSDVTVAAVGGWLVVSWCWMRWGREKGVNGAPLHGAGER